MLELTGADLAELPEKKRRLIEATIQLILRQGYNATTVEQVCGEAGVTKGSFFHYFATKEEVCKTAMAAWAGGWRDILITSRLDRIADPLTRLDRLFRVMEEAYLRLEPYTGCVIGTVAQEVSHSQRGLGNICEAYFASWTAGIRSLLMEAGAIHSTPADFDPDSVADLILGMVQGSLLVARTRQDSSIIINNLKHCRKYVLGLFTPTLS